jgi:hypothetical protein
MPNNYVEERSIPKVPSCMKSQVELKFDGFFLRATGTKRAFVFPAFSGKPNEDGELTIPLDVRRYPTKAQYPQVSTGFNHPRCGKTIGSKAFVIRAQHGETTGLLFIRTRIRRPMDEVVFFIHGGSAPGSAGCIDLTANIDRFVERLTKELRGLPKCFISLTVRYTKK